MSEESISPFLQEEFMSNKIQDSCSRALKHLSQSSLCVSLATFCDVFGAQLCPLTCFCLVFSCISDLGFWTLKEMGRLTRSLGSAHLCGTEKPANVKVLRLGGILALPYSSQYRLYLRIILIFGNTYFYIFLIYYYIILQYVTLYYYIFWYITTYFWYMEIVSL